MPPNRRKGTASSLRRACENIGLPFKTVAKKCDHENKLYEGQIGSEIIYYCPDCDETIELDRS